MPDDRFVHIHMSVEISPVRGRLPWGSNPRIVERAALRTLKLFSKISTHLDLDENRNPRT